jgi:hypothetical protein
MATSTTTIDEARVKALIKKEIRSKQDFPSNETLSNLGCTNAQLLAIQRSFSQAFNKTVATVFFSDTVYTLTDRLKEQYNPMF